MSEAGAAAASSSSSSVWAKVALAALLLPVLLFYGAWFCFELCRHDLLLVGNITVDLVDGTTPTGGAVSYASVVARALGASACVIAVAGPEADLAVFGDQELYIVPANETLTFEHSYAWWGHSRRLRVTANPNITVTKAHVPWRCRRARVVLLGPLTLHDVDAASFATQQGFWEQLLARRQLIGLMGQGFQRALGPEGQVLPLPQPSPQLLNGLSKQVQLFLSDVETDTWTREDVQKVVSSAAQVVITQGEKGATLLAHESSNSSSSSRSSSSSGGGSSTDSTAVSSGSGSSSGSGGSIREWSIPAVKVHKALDTNGAGDTFATMFMLALMRGDPNPGHTAAWAASRAVLQPQTCKPRCAPALITAPGGIPPIGQLERVWMAAVPLLQHVAEASAGPLRQLAGLVPQVPQVWQAVQWLEKLSVSSTWGWNISGRLSTAATAEAFPETAGKDAAQREGDARVADAIPHSQL